MKISNKIFKAKKSFGQNFLKSEVALRKIIEAGEIKKGDIILEIGPGKGVLTKKLLEKATLVIAVEKDYELFKILEEKFAAEIKSNTLLLINEDILNFNMSFVSSNFFSLRTTKWNSSLEKTKEDYADKAVLTFSNGDVAKQDILRKSVRLRSYKVIANIPYNITGAILKKFLAGNPQPERMVLMVQHEVAKRIVARDKKESLLSISVKAYGEPRMIMKVSARYFSPSPKVDSAIVTISGISRKTFKENDGSCASMDGARHDFAKSEESFWKIVKAGFMHKRKKLSGNLKGVLGGVELKKLGFADKRAEDLSLADWIALARRVP